MTSDDVECGVACVNGGVDDGVIGVLNVCRGDVMSVGD